MADIEKTGFLRYKDADGNLTTMYPITKVENVDGIEEIGEQIATATSTDGVNYTVTVPGITELKAGIKFTMIPGTDSTSDSVNLNVNGLGSMPLKARRLMNTGSSITAMSDNWIDGRYPITVMFNGYWWVTTDFGYAHASYLYGTVPVDSGGTGKVSLTAGSYLVGNGTGNVQLKTPAEVLADIGAASMDDVNAAITAAITGAIEGSY